MIATNTARPGHVHGLDTLRALAILLVFAYHYQAFVSGVPTFGWASEVGWVGVDLFFVLSGYLITHQLLGGLTRGAQLSLAGFYTRRVLRTWPAFWVVLAAYWLWPAALGGRTPPPLWRFLTFTQNLGLQPGTAFSHAWSLCIEEQFYLVLPLAALLAMRLRAHRSTAWIALGALLAIGIGARAVLWSAYGREASGQIGHYYPNVYYGTLCRFDEFLPGVAIALLRHLHPDRWRRLMHHGQALFGAGIAATLLMLGLALNYYYIDGYGYGAFMSVFGYSLIAWAFGLLVLAALSPSSWLHRVRIPGARPLAAASYSVYLSHKPVAYFVASNAAHQALSPMLTLLLVCAACALVGALLHRWVERPFLEWRDRLCPSNFAPPGITRAATAPAGSAP